MLDHCIGITTVSESLKEELIVHGVPPAKVAVIPNGVDISKFKVLDRSDCRSRLQIDTANPVVVYVGRLSEEKSVTTLIEAAAAVISGGQSLDVYLVGDGALKNDLISQAETLGVRENVTFVGKVGHDEVSLWMGAADFFCLPSLREGCPNVILEALGSGRPILATKVGAIPDVVSDDSGILFEPEDVDGLVKTLGTAINRGWSETVISHSVKGLSWEKAAEKYYHFYKKAV